MGIEKLILELNDLAESNKPLWLSACTDDFFNRCSRPGLLAGFAFISAPAEILQKEVKEKIRNYVKQNKLHFVATTQHICGTEFFECRGHLFDPIQPKHYKEEYKENIFIDKFPSNIHGASFYFFNELNFQTYKKMANT